MTNDQPAGAEIAPFAFAYDAEIGAPRVTLAGIWTMDTVRTYCAALFAVMKAAPPGPPSRTALFDVRAASCTSAASPRH